MEDRFKFRGITKGKVNEFVYGSLLWYAGEPQIWDKDGKNYIVKSETIQQCTGLKDKNGKLIYEGDVLKDKYGALHPISWNVKGFYEADTFAVAGFYNAIQEDMEVIGNIYENPELSYLEPVDNLIELEVRE